MDSLLIVGTDTDVGKTVLTTALGSYWHTFYSRKKLGLMKLIQTGIGDRQLYQRLFSDADSIQCVTPLWFETPVAPPIAAIRENRIIDLTPGLASFHPITTRIGFCNCRSFRRFRITCNRGVNCSRSRRNLGFSGRFSCSSQIRSDRPNCRQCSPSPSVKSTTTRYYFKLCTIRF
jgi:hypothetical protein